MAFAPSITVLIPVYNGAEYLGEAIDSALAQTYPATEVLVVNDGSTDDGRTEAVARRYGDRIRYIRKPNGGVASALNLGIAEARGEYLSWLSHDDVFVADKLEKQVAALSQRDPTTLLYGDLELIDDQGRLLARRHLPAMAPDRALFTLLAGSPVNGCTTLIKKSCFDEVGSFDEAQRTTQDLDMWIRLARRFAFVHMPEVLLRSRQHAGQGTRAMSDFHARKVDEFLIRYLGELGAAEIFGGDRVKWASGYLDLAFAFAGCERYRAADRALELARSYVSPTELGAFNRRMLRFRVYAGLRAVRRAITTGLALDRLDSDFKRWLYRLYNARSGGVR